MRAFAILILLVAFVTAVILPNDIGTHELPATGGKCVKAGLHHLLKGKALTGFVLVEKQNHASLASDTQLLVYRSVQSLATVQLSPRLLT
jgi:hypothetical protein